MVDLTTGKIDFKELQEEYQSNCRTTAVTSHLVTKFIRLMRKNAAKGIRETKLETWRWNHISAQHACDKLRDRDIPVKIEVYWLTVCITVKF